MRTIQLRAHRALLVIGLLAVATHCVAQTWGDDYEQGIQWAHKGKWEVARSSFLRAAQERSGDSETPILLPGPLTADRRWRDGALYSPNFLAAYSAYRAGLAEAEPAKKDQELATAKAELEAQRSHGHLSSEGYFVLNDLYSRQNDLPKLRELQNAYGQQSPVWRVDTSAITPEDLGAIRQMSAGARQEAPMVHAGTPQHAIVSPGTDAPTIGASKVAPTTNSTSAGNFSPGFVPAVLDKYALLIGNTGVQTPSESMPYAPSDVQAVRDGLITNAGYPAENVVVLGSASAKDMRDAAASLAARMGPDSTLLLFYTGSGANRDGKDYLFGSDPTSLDAGAMVSKSEILQPFVDRGAKIFAFFQVPRKGEGAERFGSEVPRAGSISQMEATISGGQLTSTIREGRAIGSFTNAILDVLSDFRSNRIPIVEFAWQVFYKIRRGDTGTSGGGSHQTPTLPILSNIAADARF